MQVYRKESKDNNLSLKKSMERLISVSQVDSMSQTRKENHIVIDLSKAKQEKLE